MKLLIITRGYPSRNALYSYPFVHRRVVLYRNAGHQVDVFVYGGRMPETGNTFEGVTVRAGDDKALRKQVLRQRPDRIALHGIAEDNWPAVAALPDDIPVFGWLHGSEIQAFHRRAYAYADGASRDKARKTYDRRMDFWRGLVADWPARLHLVFVSQHAAATAQEDLGQPLDHRQYSVIHNPIDTTLFRYRPKLAADRFKVLSIRPFSSLIYANDLSVKAILALAETDLFDRFRFHIIGDGALFDRQTEPLRGLGNVKLQKGFVSQSEIARLHGENGVFLVPSRADTQGVSRDEAMASGLVPVTNSAAAVPEFTDDTCAALAPPEDHRALAGHMGQMARAPELFLSRSKAAHQRIQAQTAAPAIIAQELALMKGGADG